MIFIKKIVLDDYPGIKPEIAGQLSLGGQKYSHPSECFTSGFWGV